MNARLGRFENIGHAHNEPEIPETRANDQGADSKGQTVQRFKLAEEGLLQTRVISVSLHIVAEESNNCQSPT